MNRNLRRTIVLLLVAGLCGSLATGPAAGAGTGMSPRTRAALDEVVRDGTPGVVAGGRRDGHRWTYATGTADLADERPRRRNEKFRAASITKPFTAALVLKLEAAGKLSVDDSVERWLPGVVRGAGYEPRRITIRQLLNHTSGIFNYNDDETFRARYTAETWDAHRYLTVQPRELVAYALTHPPVFAPGEPGKWQYSDTNYVLAGMIVEKATGNTYERELRQRLLLPLGLTGTKTPGTSPEVPAPHATHYSTLFEPGAEVRDVTEFTPTVAWSAGSLISTTADLNRFLSLLLAGKVLLPAQQRKMFSTVTVGGDEQHGGPEDRYGLGIRKFKLADDCWVWGHGGMIPGSASRAVGTEGGRHTFVMNRNADWGAQELEDAALRAEFCRQ